MSPGAEENAASVPGALRIGDPAPNFQARTTMGDINLSDYRGRWVLLFSHPADFTPVCTSEFVTLARGQARFRALNCELIAISVDSLYAHLAWVRAIREHFDVEIGFPIVEDPSLAIGRAYGMLAADAPDAATLRSTQNLQPGETVVAIGFPFGIGPSVSAGVVSGLGRRFVSPDSGERLTNLIQFDAAANPGNSGGPLITLDGEVVGIVTAIFNPTPARTFLGIGFAVPIENAASAVGMPPF